MSARATNEAQVFGELDTFLEQIQQTATPRALNRLRDQARVVGFRVVAQIYRLGVRQLDPYVRVTYADARTLQASIRVKGQGFPLGLFNPRQTREGVRVSLKGRSVLFPGAFIVTLSTGHKGVFVRGAYGAKGGPGFVPSGRRFGRIAFGRRRLPIQELYTFGPVEEFSNPEVRAAMDERVRAQAPIVLQSEIRFATRSLH